MAINPTVLARPGKLHLPAWQSLLAGALLAIAIVGAALAGYLAWENSQGQSGVCTIAHGCATVQHPVIKA